MASARVRTRPTAATTKKFACLDGCRALAAIAVLVTHVAFITAANERSTIGPYLARLDAGVAVFFVLSGFLLYRPMVVRHLEGRPAAGVRSYALRRFLRIFPAYWVALTAAILLLPAGHKPDLGELLRYYTLTHIYWPSTVLGPVDQAWSLGTEIAFYLALPFYAGAVAATVARRRMSVVRGELIGVAVMFVLAQLFRLVVVVPAATLTQRSLVTWLPNDLDLFALGMLLAVVHAWCEHHERRPPLGLDRDWSPLAWWAVGALAFYVVSTKVGLPAMSIDFAGPQLFARQLLYGVTAICVVAPVVFGDVRRGIIRPFLASWPLRSLGVVSYGIYLWHQIVKDRYLSWSDTAIFQGGFARVLIVVFVVTTAIAAISWFVVERPALSRRPQPSMARPS